MRQSERNIVFALVTLSILVNAVMVSMFLQQREDMNLLEHNVADLKDDNSRLRNDLIYTQYEVEKLKGNVFYNDLFVTLYNKSIVVISLDKKTQGQIVFTTNNVFAALNWATKHLAPYGNVKTDILLLYCSQPYSLSNDSNWSWAVTIEFVENPPIILSRVYTGEGTQ